MINKILFRDDDDDDDKNVCAKYEISYVECISRLMAMIFSDVSLATVHKDSEIEFTVWIGIKLFISTTQLKSLQVFMWKDDKGSSHDRKTSCAAKLKTVEIHDENFWNQHMFIYWPIEEKKTLASWLHKLNIVVCIKFPTSPQAIIRINETFS